MFYVYSTATCGVTYTLYKKNASHDLSVVEKKANGKPARILIRGGANVVDKHFVTPRGVMTAVEDDDMEILLKDKNFQRHMKAGFISYEQKEVPVAKVVADMEPKDNSSPVVPDDFSETVEEEKATKVYKRKRRKNLD